jgi:hypothetical protein
VGGPDLVDGPIERRRVAGVERYVDALARECLGAGATQASARGADDGPAALDPEIHAWRPSAAPDGGARLKSSNRWTDTGFLLVVARVDGWIVGSSVPVGRAAPAVDVIQA